MDEHRRVLPTERFRGPKVTLRLVTMEDCSERYVSWLRDVEVSRYLETRWAEQDLDSVRAFVGSMIDSAHSYLFAIVENERELHVGNIKIGPIQERHSYADISYFLGDRTVWGKGLATEAIRLVTFIAFERLGLHRVQAGLYEGNVGSSRALEKAGFTLEGRMKKQLRGPDGWEDHLWYGLLREDWRRELVPTIETTDAKTTEVKGR
jgi:RimJ/RimL family protein N-acetyltransferase